MSSLVVKQLPLLEVLTKVKKESRNKILKNCNIKLTEAIVECVFNILRNNVVLSQKHVEKMKKYKNTLRELSNPKKKLNKKRDVIIQSGGNFLPIILTPIVSYLLDKIVS